MFWFLFPMTTGFFFTAAMFAAFMAGVQYYSEASMNGWVFAAAIVTCLVTYAIHLWAQTWALRRLFIDGDGPYG